MIVLACDHGGFELKEKVKKYLEEKKLKTFDVGLHKIDPLSNFPVYAELGAREVLKSPDNRGIFICGSGIGISIAANRFRGIRAANVNNVEYAKLGRLHNDMNVLCLGGRFTDFEVTTQIIDIFLTTEHLGGKYKNRMDMLDKYK